MTKWRRPQVVKIAAFGRQPGLARFDEVFKLYCASGLAILPTPQQLELKVSNR
jgi:hypothetical protein